MSMKENILAHEHAVVGVVVVTLLAGAFLMGMKVGFEYGLARCAT
ncbi:MAG: hypothetical protein NTU61_03855 [Candidatus Altiarchaeota archaeon]|nr:hypothetical protein [Candidatus Altiarchaeota archaeon]